MVAKSISYPILWALFLVHIKSRQSKIIISFSKLHIDEQALRKNDHHDFFFHIKMYIFLADKKKDLNLRQKKPILTEQISPEKHLGLGIGSSS